MTKNGWSAFAATLLVFASGAAQAAPGQNLFILSDDSGRGMTIGEQVDSREHFAAAAHSGPDIADEFKRLCWDTKLDAAALAAAGSASRWGYNADSVTFEGGKKTPAFTQAVLAAPSARANIWTGDDVGLKGKPILIRDRGALVTSGYGPFKAAGRQCNFDLKTTALSDPAALVARLTEHLGQAPAKLVTKKSFADGHWNVSMDGRPMRVFFSVVDVNKPSQLVHLVLQDIADEKRK